MSSFVERSETSTSDSSGSSAENRTKLAKKSSSKMFKREPAHRLVTCIQ